MATEIAPIELPTGRRSYIAPARDAPDIHDPNWIPVLNDVDLRKLSEYVEKEHTPQTPTASYSPFPPRAQSPSKQKPLPVIQHSYSKSSLAPESVPSELEAEPLPPRTSSRKNATPSPVVADALSQHLRQTSAEAPSSDGQETVTSDSVADASTAPSTIGTASLLEEQYYVLPDAPVSKEDIQPPQIMSSRSSIASNWTRTSVAPPTSKYNRKPLPSVGAGRPPTIKSQATTPRDSPRMTAMPVSTTSLPLVEPLPSPKILPVEEPTIAPTASGPSPAIQASKSSASDRRARALNSHPSHPSLHSLAARSRANSNSDEEMTLPRPPSIKHKTRKSTDSRSASRNGLFDGQTPTPAPTTPLPQLPPEARTRPSTRDGLGIKVPQTPVEAHVAAPPLPTRTADHSRMASFMTTRSQIIFRRFDDVHLKLLLCLQDEITQLEQELSILENGAAMGGDKTSQQLRIMRELRRVVAEYGENLINRVRTWWS
jgi:hypothetical protein